MKSLAATCAACHGTNGHAVADTAIPGLAGRPADELAAMLRAFKNGTRPGTVMPQLAKGYDDGQITALAQYFAAQRSSRREARGASGASRPSEQRAHQDHSGDRRGRGEQP
ncbi:c-type cytochrome [Roseateles sp. YR242]|uniref:c-type cytochrome n=1 Tax=Roseateles sp. YR242 TaxID=1855305 RepID=UPI0021009109|nr:c-type cytochrome [Roseateles sp. YR242]